MLSKLSDRMPTKISTYQVSRLSQRNVSPLQQFRVKQQQQRIQQDILSKQQEYNLALEQYKSEYGDVAEYLEKSPDEEFNDNLLGKEYLEFEEAGTRLKSKQQALQTALQQQKITNDFSGFDTQLQQEKSYLQAYGGMKRSGVVYKKERGEFLEALESEDVGKISKEGTEYKYSTDEYSKSLGSFSGFVSDSAISQYQEELTKEKESLTLEEQYNKQYLEKLQNLTPQGSYDERYEQINQWANENLSFLGSEGSYYAGKKFSELANRGQKKTQNLTMLGYDVNNMQSNGYDYEYKDGKLVRIAAKPKQYTTRKSQSSSESGFYTPYELLYDEKGQMVSETVKEPVITRDMRFRGGEYVTEFSVLAKAKATQQSIIKQEMYQPEQEGGGGFSFNWYSPYEKVNVKLENMKLAKKTELSLFQPKYEEIYKYERSPQGGILSDPMTGLPQFKSQPVYWKKGNTYLQREIDYKQGIITDYNKPYEQRISNWGMAASVNIFNRKVNKGWTPKVSQVINPFTNTAWVTKNGRTNVYKLRR